MSAETFKDHLAALEARALQIQIDHFKIAPECRGRAFYAMELVGETGELINGCKKYIRTRLAHRRNHQVRSHIPEEAADTLVALMLIKLAAGDTRLAVPPYPAHVPYDNIPWLHTCLSSLAFRTASVYVRESDLSREPDFSLEDYSAIVSTLLHISVFFGFQLEQAAYDKLERIIEKVEAGYYD